MNKLVLVAGAAAAAALLAGCGGGNATGASDSTTPTPSAPATVTDTVVPPPTTVAASGSASAPSGPVACATTNLTVTLGTGQGAAGSTVYPVHFVNKGSSSCTITGYPGVSFVAPSGGTQVGQPAQRSGAAERTVTLSPGAEATSLVKAADYQNFDPNQCQATAVSGFRVYPPNNQTSAYVAFPAQTMACSIGTTQLDVQPVAPGTTGS